MQWVSGVLRIIQYFEALNSESGRGPGGLVVEGLVAYFILLFSRVVLFDLVVLLQIVKFKK